MFNPSHPGEALRKDVLPALGVNVTQAAEQLGVSRITLSRMLNGQAAISINMACRLEQWLRHADGTGPSAESWLSAQLQYDLWQARQTPLPAVQPAPSLEASEI